jgi:probable HAF family extracellular repeat protein
MKRQTLVNPANQITNNNTSQTKVIKTMNIKQQFIAMLSCVSVLASLAGATPTAWAQYSLTDLGVLPGKIESVPAAINNMAQVVGTSSAGATAQSAFRYDDNGKKALEEIGRIHGGEISRAFGINEVGQVVGDSTFGSINSRLPVSHAVLFNNGLVQDLGFLKGGYYSRANGINASGQVVGFSSPTRDGTNSRAFIWTASSGMTDIGTLGGPYAQAYGINDIGYVTGTSQAVTGVARATRAFLYQPLSMTMRFTRQMQDLGTLGGNSSYGMSINATNHVAGYSELNNTDDRIHAFLHDGTKMRDLGSLGAKMLESDKSYALGINVADQVVGYSYLPAQTDPPSSRPEPQQVAFFYERGQMIDLNTWIGALASKYHLDAATSINDKAQITAIALDKNTNALHAVLLTPTGK